MPERAADDPAVPLRLRLFFHLQRLGAALEWIEVSPSDLAAFFSISRKTVYRLLSQLVAAGYLLARTHSGERGGRVKAYMAVIDERPSTVFHTPASA